MITERSSLSAGHEQPDVAIGALDRFAVLVGSHDFFQLHDQPVGAAVVTEPDRTEHEYRIDWLDEFEHAGNRFVIGRRQVVEHPPEVLDDCTYLLLLTLHGDPLTALAGLQKERACSWLTDRPGRERVNVVELVEHAQDGTLTLTRS